MTTAIRLQHKVAWVTGAAQGIGLACAEALAGEGARVLLTDIATDKLNTATEQLKAKGLEVAALTVDAGDKASVEAAVAHAVARWGRLDIAVANAGIVHACDFLDIEEDDFDRVLRVNLKGVFLTGQAAARQMVQQTPDADGERGVIINMSSVNAVLAIPSIVSYVTAKGGVAQLTKAEALALIDKGIRVNAIGPGSVATEVFASVANNPEKRRAVLSRTPIGRAGEPQEIGRVCVFLASKDASYMVGQTIYPDGGRLALNYTVPVSPPINDDIGSI
jgi:NAD(P)-dependent dehydrogenase (short-subunit alcohol dehydrogenase family)